MKHKIDDQEVEIERQQGDLLEAVDCYCKEYAVTGIGSDGNKYEASAIYFDGELDYVHEETIIKAI